MSLYDTSKAATLCASEPASLTVTGAGMEIKAKVVECTNYANKLAAAMMMSVEQGKFKGCRWVLTGGVNRSEWMGAADLMCKITRRDKTTITDPKEMEEDGFIRRRVQHSPRCSSMQDGGSLPVDWCRAWYTYYNQGGGRQESSGCLCSFHTNNSSPAGS